MENKIIARVKKLLTLANNDGATEGERDNALRMAYATLAKYNLTLSDVTQTGATEEARGELVVEFLGVIWARTIADHIAKLFFCKYLFVKISANTDNCRHYFIGRQSNVTTASYLAEFVVKSVHREGKERTRGMHYSDYRAFGLGAATRIVERCRALREEQEKEQKRAPQQTTSQTVPNNATTAETVQTIGTALVLASLYQTEIEANDAFVKARYAKVKTGSAGHKVRNLTAFDAGRECGSRVSLTPQVSGSRHKQLTGEG